MMPQGMVRQAPARLPFLPNTRHRFRKAGTITYADNTTEERELPRLGFISRVINQLRGTMNTGAATSLTNRGPWEIVGRYSLELNVGNNSICDFTGFGGSLVTHIQEKSGRSDLGGFGSTTAATDYYNAGVANGNNTWSITQIIPVAANQGSSAGTGLINIQSPQVRLVNRVRFNQETDALTTLTGGTGLSATLHIYTEYFEVPDISVVQSPPLVLNRWQEQQTPILSTGETNYTIVRQGQLLNLIQYVRLNGSLNSTDINNLRVRFNQTDTVYDFERQIYSFYNRQYNGFDNPTGVFYWDFWHAGEQLSAGPVWRNLDTERIATIDFVTDVASGATLGSNNNFVNSIRHSSQLLQV